VLNLLKKKYAGMPVHVATSPAIVKNGLDTNKSSMITSASIM
jgi:hypothetical protein